MKFEALWSDETLTLSSMHEFDVRYFLPPPELQQHINLFYIFRSEQTLIRDVQPASAGHIMLFLNGTGEARFIDASIQSSHDVTLIGPSTSAMQYIVRGPFHAIGCTLNPSGYSCLTGTTAAPGINKLADANDVINDDFGPIFTKLRSLNDRPESPNRDQAMVDQLSQFLVGKFKSLKPIPAKVIELFFNALEANLDTDVNDLYPKLPVSQRQMQRICNDYLGAPPKYIIRKFRAVRAAMLLSDPNCTEETRDLVNNQFYDQPHMIREIALFNGRTPKYLAGERAPLLKMWFASANQPQLAGVYGATSKIISANKS